MILKCVSSLAARRGVPRAALLTLSAPSRPPSCSRSSRCSKAPLPRPRGKALSLVLRLHCVEPACSSWHPPASRAAPGCWVIPTRTSRRSPHARRRATSERPRPRKHTRTAFVHPLQPYCRPEIAAAAESADTASTCCCSSSTETSSTGRYQKAFRACCFVLLMSQFNERIWPLRQPPSGGRRSSWYPSAVRSPSPPREQEEELPADRGEATNDGIVIPPTILLKAVLAVRQLVRWRRGGRRPRRSLTPSSPSA